MTPPSEIPFGIRDSAYLRAKEDAEIQARVAALSTPQHPGALISFEGIDGCGKTTQIELLRRQLRKEGLDVVVLREPGGTDTGENIRRILKDRNSVKCPETELLLFLAARAQLVQQVLRPHLEAGRIVILDRFIDSTVAYQGAGRGLDVATIRRLNEFATGGLEPDMTIYLDVSVTTAQRRLTAITGSGQDAFDTLPSDFFERVRGAYLGLAEQHKRIRTVDATQGAESIAVEVRRHLLAVLAQPVDRVPSQTKSVLEELQARSSRGAIGEDMPTFDPKLRQKVGGEVTDDLRAYAVQAKDIANHTVFYGTGITAPEFQQWYLVAASTFKSTTGLDPNVVLMSPRFASSISSGFHTWSGDCYLELPVTCRGFTSVITLRPTPYVTVPMRLAYRQDNGAVILAEPKSDAHKEWAAIAANFGAEDGGPDAEDGPWAEGWYGRCGPTHSKSILIGVDWGETTSQGVSSTAHEESEDSRNEAAAIDEEEHLDGAGLFEDHSRKDSLNPPAWHEGDACWFTNPYRHKREQGRITTIFNDTCGGTDPLELVIVQVGVQEEFKRVVRKYTVLLSSISGVRPEDLKV